MNSHTHKVKVAFPTLAEFAQKYPQYGPRARAEGRPLFEHVMRAETFNDAEVLTRILGVPAVSAVAASATEIASRDLTGTDKQFLGAAICALMEKNGFAKTGRKRAIPHPSWNRGEVYEIVRK